MNYFMIYCSEDGEPRVYAMDREQVLKYIQHKENASDEFWESLGFDADPNYWRGKILLIKGDLVFPKPIKVVQEWELE